MLGRRLSGSEGRIEERGGTDEAEVAAPEFDVRLESASVGQRQDPEEFYAAAALVHVHFDRFLFFLANLNVTISIIESSFTTKD